jgi:hypothetical protein
VILHLDPERFWSMNMAQLLTLWNQEEARGRRLVEAMNGRSRTS